MLRRISSFPSTPASPRSGSFRPKGGTSIPSKASIGTPESAATSSASGTTSSDGAGYPASSPARAYILLRLLEGVPGGGDALHGVDRHDEGVRGKVRKDRGGVTVEARQERVRAVEPDPLPKGLLPGMALRRPLGGSCLRDRRARRTPPTGSRPA